MVDCLIQGRSAFICNECVVLCREILGPRPPVPADGPDPTRTTIEEMPSQPAPDDDEDVTAERKPPDEQHCSFCRKAKTDVARPVHGPTVYICNECVELCEDIIASD